MTKALSQQPMYLFIYLTSLLAIRVADGRGSQVVEKSLAVAQSGPRPPLVEKPLKCTPTSFKTNL